MKVSMMKISIGKYPAITPRSVIALTAAAVLALILLLGTAGGASAQAGQHTFSGAATVNSQAIAEGSSVVAATADNPYQAIALTDASGQYTLTVGAGLEIRFYVNGVDTGINRTTAAGSTETLDLNANTGSTTQDPQQFMHRFYGRAAVDGRSAPLGAFVTALAGSRIVHRTLVNSQGQYSLKIPLGETVGTALTFAIDGLPTGHTDTVRATSDDVLLNLTANTQGIPPAQYTPPAPSPTTPATAAPAPPATTPPTAVPAQPTAPPAATAAPAQPTPVVVTATPAPAAPAATQAVVVATQVPAAQPAQTGQAFRVGPTVRLRPLNDVIEANSDGLVEVLFRNPALNDNAMVVDLSVSVPSGFHLYGDGFASDVAAGTASATYSVPPGNSRTIYINLKAEKVGRTNIQFSAVYWPEGNKDAYSPVSLTHPFEVLEASADPLQPPADTGPVATVPAAAPAQQQGGSQTGSSPPADSDPSASCSLSPDGSAANGAGDMALLALPLLALGGLVWIRRRRS